MYKVYVTTQDGERFYEGTHKTGLGAYCALYLYMAINGAKNVDIIDAETGEIVTKQIIVKYYATTD